MRKNVYLLLLLLFHNLAYAETNYYYQVQEDDSLSVILYSIGIFPISIETPNVLSMNKVDIQKNPNFIRIGEKINLPIPNPLFAQNYEILADGEILIHSKIKTQKQKDDFLKRKNLKEVYPTEKKQAPPTITHESNEDLIPRQVERVYINYGLLLDSTTSEQILPSGNNPSGVNQLNSLNYGVSIEASFRFRHSFYFDAQNFLLPEADESRFSDDRFNLFNFSYKYAINLSKHLKLQAGFLRTERVYFTSVTQELITLDKTSHLLPTFGVLYLSHEKYFNLLPRLSLSIAYRSQKEIDQYEISSGFEYSALTGAFINLDESSHVEVSAGVSYRNYELNNMQSTDIEGKFIIKWGKEYFF